MEGCVMEVVELYKFVIGSQSYLYTNAPTDIEHGGDTYSPEAIARSEIVQGQEINRAGITITVPRTNPVAELFYGWPPDIIMSATVYRKRGETVLTYWKGRVSATRSNSATCSIECESIFTSMRRTGARARYQRQCRHSLYGRGCGVDKDNYASAATVTGVVKNVVTVESAGDGYIGGFLVFGGEARLIAWQAGNELTLWRQISGIDT